MFCKEVISVSGKLWIVQRKIRISHNPIVEVWREHLKSNGVFKKEPYFYFCEEIIDVEPIEENLT
jgi:hypothetical protein